MAEHVPCSYCLEIPPIDKAHKGKIEHCPLCHTEILVTSGGASYRLRTEDGEEIPMPASKGSWLSSIFSGGGAVLLIALGWLAWSAWLRPAPDQPGPRVETPVPNIEEAPAPALALMDGAKDQFPDVFFMTKPPLIIKGMAKPAGVSHVVGSAKPASTTVTGVSKTFEPSYLLVYEMPPPKPALPPAVPWYLQASSPDVLRAQLASAPELLLEDVPHTLSDKQAAQAIAEQIKKIRDINGKTSDAFVKQLVEKRDDLAGLPFLMSPDCELGKEKAAKLLVSSRMVRDNLDEPRTKKNRYRSENRAEAFWLTWKDLMGDSNNFDGNSTFKRAKIKLQEDAKDASLPALLQILDSADAEMCKGLVNYLRGVETPAGTAALVRKALYDADAGVRNEAVKALAARPDAQYDKLLLDGLKHPFAPVSFHAASAIVQLKRDNLVPKLIDMLELADPAAPFVRKVDGKDVPMIREMVKINHHRNCLMCHAPANNERDELVGLIPNPSQPLPSSSRIYYELRDGQSGVRADIVYLRQDFSAMLPVPKTSRWPEMQRFDFVVRERPLTGQERARWQNPVRREKDDQLSPFHLAVLSTLRELTGVNLAPEAAAWRNFPIPKMPPSPAWRTPCLK